LFYCVSSAFTVRLPYTYSRIFLLHQALNYTIADAGIFIPSEDLASSPEQFNFLLGGIARVPLGTPLKELAVETFAPFFNRVFHTGRKDYEITPYVIEVNIKDFQITQGFDTYLVIRCQISTEDDIVFFDEFSGSGKGTAAAGLFDDKDKARDQIRKSAEAAFIEAFESMQKAFIAESGL